MGMCTQLFLKMHTLFLCEFVYNMHYAILCYLVSVLTLATLKNKCKTFHDKAVSISVCLL